MQLNTLEVAGILPAMIGMRNPKNSWHLTDTVWADGPIPEIGPNDMELAQRLVRAGNEHAKFMRQIMVWVNIKAPIYWWSEFDTYKVGVTRNSCSTMHTLITELEKLKDSDEVRAWLTDPIGLPKAAAKHFEVDDDCLTSTIHAFYDLMQMVEDARGDADREWWDPVRFKIALKRALPSNWLQQATISMSYQNVRKMLQERRHHQLGEWNYCFVNWAKTLPYAKELLFLDLK